MRNPEIVQYALSVSLRENWLLIILGLPKVHLGFTVTSYELFGQPNNIDIYVHLNVSMLMTRRR